MPDVLEAGMVLHLRMHHGMLIRRRSPSGLTLVSLISAFIILVVISAALVRKVCRALMFMRTAIVLEPAYYLVDFGR